MSDLIVEESIGDVFHIYRKFGGDLIIVEDEDELRLLKDKIESELNEL